MDGSLSLDAAKNRLKKGGLVDHDPPARRWYAKGRRALAANGAATS